MMRNCPLLVRLLGLALLGITAAHAREACSPEKMADVLALPFVPSAPWRAAKYVDIDCDLTLRPGDVVRKSMVMSGSQGSNLTVDCNGATIRGFHESGYEAIIVTSNLDRRGQRPRWRGASNVTVRNCNVEGRIRIAGGGPSLWESSYDPDHTTKIQARSPKDIVFDNLHIRADGEVPFYVFPGALRVTLMNSEISGDAGGPAIYLDAESAENVIKDNVITASTRTREHIAIDGSARNLIVGNRFSGYAKGGIFIYRNCGEDTKRQNPRKGVIRHQYPADNVILDNVFDFSNYRADWPSVWVASRQGRDGIGYCGDDENEIRGERLGSQIDNDDHAYRTVVAENRFVGGPDVGSFMGNEITMNGDPSYAFYNTHVHPREINDRESPCFVANGYPKPMLASGDSVDTFDDGSGPRCTGQRLTCNDGRLTTSRAHCTAERASDITVVPFGCRAYNNDSGCTGRVACPAQTVFANVKAACNLELSLVSDEELAMTPWSFAGIVKRSDNSSDGACQVGGAKVGIHGQLLQRHSGPIEFSCREMDSDGGDCHVRGLLACRNRDRLSPSP